MSKRILLVAALLLCAVPALAGDEPIQYAGFGGLSLGARYLKTASLNDYLEPIGAELGSVAPLVGGHAYAVLLQRLVIGAQGEASFLADSGRTADADLWVSDGSLDVGYAVANGGSGLAFPFVGFGGYRQVVEVKNASRLEVIELFGGHDKIYQDGAMLRVGMAYRFPLRFAENPASGGFAFFAGGVTGGATFDLGRTGWRVDADREVRGGPDLPMHTLFVQVDLSFGGGTAKIY